MSEPPHRCARCKRPMHPLQNCVRAPDGLICIPCDKTGVPKYLHSAPPVDDPKSN